MRSWWGGCAILIACGDPGGTASTTSTTTGSTDTTATGVAADTSSSGAAESSTGEAPMYEPPSPTCRLACALAADCCAGIDQCPSQSYPGNVNCVDGLCIPATCSNDAECDPGFSCRDLFGIGECVVLCGSDADCAPAGSTTACDGQTVDGDAYCRERCDLGEPCPLGTCDAEGVCRCDSDDQCLNLFVCV